VLSSKALLPSSAMVSGVTLAGRRGLVDAARLAGGAAGALAARRAIGAGIGSWSPDAPQTLLVETLLIVVVLVTVAGLIRRSGPALAVAFMVIAVNLGLLVPVFPLDPVPVALMMLWLASILVRWLVPEIGRGSRTVRRKADLKRRLTRERESATRYLLGSALAIVLAVLAHGSGPSGSVVARVFAFIALAAAAPALFRAIRMGRRFPILAVVFAVLSVAAVLFPVAGMSLAAIALFFALADSVIRLPVAEEVLEFVLARPAFLTWLSFMALIAVGTFLLGLPAASAMTRTLTPTEALFTATSASCVTGLIVVDTAKDLSVFGQIVVLGLMQIGGLSIMVLSGFAVMAIGESLGLKGDHALREVLDQVSTAAANRLVTFVVGATLVIEAVGATILGFAAAGTGLSGERAAWEGVFHSVSAFCNAGFALHSDSVIGASKSPVVLLTMAALIVVGGLGFPVLGAGWARIRGVRSGVSRLQVRLVLRWTTGLILVGFVWFVAVEWNGVLAGLSPLDRLVNALFQSVTLRTAGFNSVGYQGLGSATILLMIVMMIVGASPGGTGGGLKTTTVAVLFGVIPAAASGRRRVVLGRRSVPIETVFRCAAIAGLGLVVLMAGTLTLLLFENGAPMTLMFEAASAVGTVGLSLGATPRLDLVGRAVIIALMFLGRVGPLSLAMVLATRKAGRVEYPEARLMVG